MQLPSENELKWFDRHKVPRPTHEEHGLADTFDNPLSDQLKPGNPRNWRAEGHKLFCDTDFGVHVQNLPTNVIFTGIDKKGLPTFREL